MDWGELEKKIVSVTVSKPEQQGKGRKMFTDFLVTALFDNGAEALSRRTFEDFEWLYHRLVKEYLGIIVPVLPERKPANAADKFAEAFVNDCQTVLQRFMERIIAHPDLLQSSNLLKFVTSNPADWKTIKEQAEKEETTSADGSLHSDPTSDSVLFIDADAAAAPLEISQKKPGMMSRWWAERAERKALNNPKYQMEENPQETKKFNDIEDYCDHLYECIAVIEENAKVLTAAYQTQSERLQTIGAAFQQLWGEHELSNTSASAMYQTVGDSWGSLHKQVEGQHAFGVAFLDTPMEEMRLDVMALKQALKKRKKVVYDYTVKVKESRSLQNQMDKLKRVPDLSAIAEKYYKTEHLQKAKDAEVAEAKHLADTMCSRLTRDIERFRIEFHQRMQEVLHNYHTAQASFLSGQSQLFLDAVPAIANMKSGRTQLPTSSPPKQMKIPGLKISTSTAGTKITLDSPAAAEHYVGQVSLPPPAAKSPPAPSPAVTTPSREKQTLVPHSPEKQSIPVPDFDDDDDGAFFGSAPMGGTTGDQTPTMETEAASAPPPAAAPPLPPTPPPPPPQEEPPLPPSSSQEERPPAQEEPPLPPSSSLEEQPPPQERPTLSPSSPQEEQARSPPAAKPTLPPLSPDEEPDVVLENDSRSDSSDDED